MREKQRQRLLDFEGQLIQLLTVDEVFERASDELLSKFKKEDKRLERKPPSFRGESLAVYFSMWANTAPDGGLIGLGINDDGSFEGCADLDQKTLNAIESTGFTFCPDARHEFRRIRVRNRRGVEDFIILIRVYYHRTIVVKTVKGDAYIRRADTKHKMTPEEVRELAVDKKQLNIEEEPCTLKFPDDFRLAAIAEWAKAVRAKLGCGEQDSDIEILAARHLGRINSDGSFIPNYACALLFAKDPCGLVPGCKIRFLRYDGETEGTGENYNVVKDIPIEGTIEQIIDRADSHIQSQLRTFRPLQSETGRFYPVPEYPRLAWYEAIVNACVHRSYGNGMKNMPVFVRMFDDHLAIESPGPLPPYVTPESIYDVHQPRNPRIMDALWFQSIVQMNREGTRRMRDTMAEMNLPAPEFSEKQHSEIGHCLVRVTLRNNIKLRRVWVDQDVSKLVSAAIAADLTQSEKRMGRRVPRDQGESGIAAHRHELANRAENSLAAGGPADSPIDPFSAQRRQSKGQRPKSVLSPSVSRATSGRSF